MVRRPDWAMRSWIALNINEFRLFDMSGSPCRKVEILTTIKQLNNSNSSSNKVHRRLGEASFPDTKLAYRLISKNPSVNLPHHRPPAARPLGCKMTQRGGPRDPQVVSDSAGGGTGQPVKAVGHCRRREPDNKARRTRKEERTLRRAAAGQGQ